MSKAIAIALVAIALIAVGYLYSTNQTSNNQFYQQNLSNAGAGQQGTAGTLTNTNNANAPPSVCPAGQSICQVTVSLQLRDALDLSSADTDVTNAVTTYYKSTDGVKFYQVGASVGNTASITYDASYNGVLYAGVSIPANQNFYVAPSAISDKNLNSRILAYNYADPVGLGTKVWLFKIDMTNLPTPLAGQTVSTVPLTVLLYASGTDSLNSPADQLNVSNATATKSFIRWIDTITTDKANAHYEYEIKFNTTNTAFVNIATTTVNIPNIGNVALSSMTPSTDGTNTFYKYTLSSDLQKANFVVSPKNGDSAQYFTVTLSTNAPSKLGTTLTIRSYSPALAGQSASDLVCISSHAAC